MPQVKRGVPGNRSVGGQLLGGHGADPGAHRQNLDQVQVHRARVGPLGHLPRPRSQEPVFLAWAWDLVQFPEQIYRCYVAPHTPCGLLYLVHILTGCWLARVIRLKIYIGCPIHVVRHKLNVNLRAVLIPGEESRYDESLKPWVRSSQLPGQARFQLNPTQQVWQLRHRACTISCTISQLYAPHIGARFPSPCSSLRLCSRHLGRARRHGRPGHHGAGSHTLLTSLALSFFLSLSLSLCTV